MRGTSSSCQGSRSRLYGRTLQKQSNFGRDHGWVTLFVDNLPDWMENRWLRNMFKWYGEIADVFVPRKKMSGAKLKYGFVRFYKERDAELAIQKCNGAWRWNKRLLVKRALYEKGKEGVNNQKVTPTRQVWKKKVPPVDPVVNDQREAMHPTARTYADVVAGRNSNTDKAELHRNTMDKNKNHGIETIKIEKVDNSWANRCVVGSIIHFNNLRGLQESFVREGVFDITVRYMAGFLVVLEFHSEETMKLHLEDTTWLDQWVNDIRPWHPNLFLHERSVWLSIVGVPLHAWMEDNFRMIAERFGVVIEVDGNTKSKKKMDCGRILIATKLLEPIFKEFILEVCNQNFLVTVREESLGHLSFAKVHASFPAVINPNTQVSEDALPGHNNGSNNNLHDDASEAAERSENDEVVRMEGNEEDDDVAENVPDTPPIGHSFFGSPTRSKRVCSSLVSSSKAKRSRDLRCFEIGAAAESSEEFQNFKSNTSALVVGAAFGPCKDSHKLNALAKSAKRKKRLVGEILGWKKKHLRTKRASRRRKKEFVKEPVVDSSSLSVSASISDGGIANCNQLILQEAQSTWEVIKRADEFMKLEVIKGDRFILIKGEILKGNFKCVIGNIYAPNDVDERLALWNLLRPMKSSSSEPWYLCGDFNEILLCNEQKGCISSSRVESVWSSIQSNGRAGLAILNKFKALRRSLVSWNKSAFGSVDLKVKSLSAAINDLDKLQEQRDLFAHEWDLKLKLTQEYWSTINSMESLWRQKSRIQWRREGDRNTKFFHAIARGRRRANLISCLEINRVKTEDPNLIKRGIVEYFTSIFSSVQWFRPFLEDISFKSLDIEDS
ncbi:hypothetical protein L1049_011971 [Liquidambar formosana]|uniref:RRM domain-containing protein n=1 Tax=Liquidambar formosana TaxID=63359 RepID=A0AAP0X079_LIQFO